jgi:hypothetical protein
MVLEPKVEKSRESKEFVAIRGHGCRMMQMSVGKVAGQMSYGCWPGAS